MSATTAAQLQARVATLSRSTLRGYGGYFREFEVEKFNPRSFHRKMIVELEDMGLLIRSGQDEALMINTEPFGRYTGWFVSKILSTGSIFGKGEVEYKTTPAWVAIVSFLVIIAIAGVGYISKTTGGLLAGVIIGLIAGIVVYAALRGKSKNREQFHIRLDTTVGVYTQGEVTEKKVDQNGQRVTELFADGLISIGGYVSVSPLYQLTPAASKALLVVEPSAYSTAFRLTPAFGALLSAETNASIDSAGARLKQSVDELVQRTSKFAALRDIKVPIFNEARVAAGPAALLTDVERSRLKSFVGSDFADADPKEFQSIMAMMFRGLGYGVQEQQYVGDYGADLVLTSGTSKIIVQLKKYSEGNKVGAPEIQKAIGSIPKFGAQKAYFVTTSTYTEQAKEQAQRAPITLVDGTELAKVIRDVLGT